MEGKSTDLKPLEKINPRQKPRRTMTLNRGTHTEVSALSISGFLYSRFQCARHISVSFLFKQGLYGERPRALLGMIAC